MGLWGLAATLAIFAESAVTSVPDKSEQIDLRPLTDWSTQRLDDGCIISRKFGDPAAPTTLELRNYDPWDGGFNVALSGPQFAARPASFMAGWFPGGRFVEIDAPTFERGASGFEAVLFHHAPWNAAIFKMSSKEWDAYYNNGGPKRFLQAIEGLSLSGVSGKSIRVLTGAMDQVIEDRDQCIHEMLAARGVDPSDEHRNDHRVRLKDREDLTRQLIADVPESIRLRTKKTFVQFLLYVGADGNPSYCRLLAMPYDAAYEQRSCTKIMRSAKFEFKKGEKAQPTFFKIGAYYVPPGAS